ncbi:lipopolysaccharide assembly protein LapA domain-containing protein [Pseudomonas sp. KK4]|uniref:lipopolysaccharide assembly protein LapA domain-containing protein n=1 Tax=Pseudomonas sp. KK4 TaxID=1855729 RepID=UPI00097C95EC|nr:LapA family protein [Pseudomonas sp. KK4]
MRNIKRVLLVIIMLLLIFVILAFMLENQQSVTLLFLGWEGPELPISFVLVAALLAGMVISPVLGLFFGRIYRFSRRRLT